MTSYRVHSQTVDSKREEYRKYLENAGLLDILTRVLTDLFEMEDKPDNVLKLHTSLDNHIHGKSFANEADLRRALANFFASKIPDFYRQGIAQLESRGQKVLLVNGDYFED